MGLDDVFRKELEPIARAAARQYGIPEEVFIRLITQESNWNPGARNKTSGAAGIAQFMPDTAREMGIDPMKPVEALGGAARYLKQMIDYYGGDVQKGVAAYNYGPGNMDRIIQQGGANWQSLLPKETQGYLAAVQPESLRVNGTATTTTGTTAAGGLARPRIEDYQQTNPDTGEKFTDWGAYYQAEAGWRELTKPKDDKDDDDFASYLDAAIRAMGTEIEQGNANVSKAAQEFSRRLDAYNVAGDQFSQLLGYAVPANATHVPGREPGGFYARMGLEPLQASGQYLNPFQEAMNIVNSTPDLTTINTDATGNLFQQALTIARGAAPGGGQSGGGGASVAAPPSTPPSTAGAKTAQQIADEFMRFNQGAMYPAPPNSFT